MVNFKNVKYDDKQITAIAYNFDGDESKGYNITIDRATKNVKGIPEYPNSNCYENWIRKACWAITDRLEENGGLNDEEWIAWG